MTLVFTTLSVSLPSSRRAHGLFLTFYFFSPQYLLNDIYYEHTNRPEECPAIKRFATAKGVEFTMMDKIDVNGVDSHPVYHYLKKIAGPVRMGFTNPTSFL